MEKEKNTAQKGDTLRLDYKRTILVGFAFFGIMCFWEVYDYIMPLILNTRFGLNSWQYGLIMGLDNLLAIFLLPLFGSISDKSVNARMGRRTKFIFWGSIAAAVALIILSIFELLEFQKIMAAGYADTAKLMEYNPALADAITGAGLNLNTSYADLMATKDTAILSALKQAQIAMAGQVAKDNVWILVMFIIALLLLLVSMSSYRSPAVSLMPDITPKPLRSQANALITFMGGAGGLVAIVLYKIFANKETKNYLWLFIATATVLLLILLAFMLTVKEKKFVQLREEEEEKYNVVDEEEAEGTDKLPKAKLVSLFLILMTVFLWFMGYNAVKSHLSTYATQTLLFEQGYVGTISILNGAGGAIALLPVALLANKLGRKKTIIIGVVVAALAFIPCFFMTANTAGVKYLFPLCFLLAGFGMVCVNVNTLPMVTELSRGSTVGKYTGYYYAFSMSAQAVTPAFAGIFMDKINQSTVFIYASIFIGLALLTTVFIKHGDNKPPKKKKMLEYFSDED
ncbi:MAG: MFS transporter [Clostridia bacterium]|nr:MFS transporter [Clostridia bacterium]MDE6604715.1 MFS transporter [Clostridia bacterium]